MRITVAVEINQFPLKAPSTIIVHAWSLKLGYSKLFNVPWRYLEPLGSEEQQLRIELPVQKPDLRSFAVVAQRGYRSGGPAPTDLPGAPKYSNNGIYPEMKGLWAITLDTLEVQLKKRLGLNSLNSWLRMVYKDMTEQCCCKPSNSNELGKRYSLDLILRLQAVLVCGFP